MNINKKKVFVSIGVPTYNSAEFIEETLESILQQSYQNIEIIVSDNGSSDKTKQIVEIYSKRDSRIKLIENRIFKNNYAGNCNNIIKYSKGEYIAIYHSDDIYDKNILEYQVKALERSNYAGCFCRRKRSFKRLINEKVTYKHFVNKFNRTGGTGIDCPTSLIRKNIYEEIGGYDENLKYIEDIDMWARILKKYPLLILPMRAYWYRIHSKQGSNYYKSDNRITLRVDYVFILELLSKEKIKVSKKFYKLIEFDVKFILKNSFELNDNVEMIKTFFDIKCKSAQSILNWYYETQKG